MALVKNWKTTLAGVAMILAAIAKIMNAPDQTQQTDVLSILGGLGFIFAKDASNPS